VVGIPETASDPDKVTVVDSISPLGSSKGSVYVPLVEKELVTASELKSSGIGGALFAEYVTISLDKSPEFTNAEKSAMMEL
jgi:hypothetical protein